jgi:spermidine synthase
VLASRRPLRPADSLPDLPQGLRFLSREGLPSLFSFPKDMGRVPMEPNRLSNQRLVQVFEQEWGRVRE